MWIWFNRYGFLQEKLIHGPEARVGTTNFKIFAYFNGLDTDYYPEALIRFERPDLHGSEYPTMFMQKVTLTYEPVEDDTESINFRTNEQYTGYLFDFGNFTGEEDVVRLLDTPGLWRATVTLIGENREMNVAGLIKFNVEPAVSSVDDEQDPQDPDISYFIEQIAIELATKLEKDSDFYVREHYNFVQAAQDGELSKEIFQPGSVVYNRADSAMYMINTVTDNPNIEDGHYVFATYSILDYNDGRVGYLELDASSSGSTLSQAEYEQVLKDICLIKCGNYWYYKFNYSQPGGSTELYVFGRFADFSSNSGTINIKRQSITINKNTRVWNLTTLLNYNFYDKSKIDSLIGSGIGYLEIYTSSGTLTDDEMAMVNKDYCIIKYAGSIYYKTYSVINGFAVFHKIPNISSISNYWTESLYTIEVNLQDNSYIYSAGAVSFYDKSTVDSLLPGYIELSGASGSLTDSEYLEITKDYCVLNVDGAYYYKVADNTFYKTPWLNTTNLTFQQAMILISGTTPKTWHIEISNKTLTVLYKHSIYIETSGTGRNYKVTLDLISPISTQLNTATKLLVGCSDIKTTFANGLFEDGNTNTDYVLFGFGCNYDRALFVFSGINMTTEESAALMLYESDLDEDYIVTFTDSVTYWS